MRGHRSPNSHFKSFNFCILSSFSAEPARITFKPQVPFLECFLFNYSGKFTETMAAVPLRFLLISFFTCIPGDAQYVMQDAALLHYINRRILSVENRLEKCNRDIVDFVQEFREFSKRMMSRLEGLNVLKTELKNDVDHLLSRVERAQREIDYFESEKESSNTCVEIDEDLVEQQLIEEEETRRKVKLMLNASCNYMLAGIKSLKIVKKAGDTDGSWLKDPEKNYQKIYFLTGTKNKIVLEFANIRVFTESSDTQSARRVALPFPWQGTGHTVYNGFLFYHRHGSLNEIIKFDIQNRSTTGQMLLSGVGEAPAYELNPSTKIDLAVDELGLWTIYTESNTNGKLVITKINPETMTEEHTWDTPCKRQNAEAAFMMCGALYVLYNSPVGGTSRIECIYDTLQTISPHEVLQFHFPKRQASHSMVHYNSREKQLFAWDNGSQIIYKFLTKQKS
ncbi:olfactomedin-like protein 1 [Sphaerodactylus townsendi]|uniref:olfactomedin-like protein 1 n=1 Tax=Sphaerodactylus townsendi TaxID=933632 RepID=UPI002027246B|nr:olfactomedin-like protein 1 [Sphaerodactylus townsendi]